MFGLFGIGKLEIESRSICDRGLARQDNQDCLVDDPGRGLFCVADGMGGAAAGDVASRLVCEGLRKVPLPDDPEGRMRVLNASIDAANAQIGAYARAHEFARMGSTLALLLIGRKSPHEALIANIGDSRVYRRRGIKLERMTEDHRSSAFSHLLTRALGVAETVQTDWYHASVCKGDVWLVCSDGVHEMLPDSTINALIARGGSASDIAERIEQSVRRAGARDNYSIVVART